MKKLLTITLIITALFSQDKPKKHIYIKINHNNKDYLYESNQDCKLISGGKYDINTDYQCYEFVAKRSGYVEVHTNFWLNCDTQLYAENGKLLAKFWAGTAKLHKYIKRGRTYRIVVIPKNERCEWVSINLP